MKKIKAAVVGYGNIGRYVLEALDAAPDFEVAGVVRRDASNVPDELRGYRVVDSVEKLEGRSRRICVISKPLSRCKMRDWSGS